MSTFDVDAFMTQSVETSNATSRVPLPEGDYPGAIEKVEARTGQKEGRDYYILDITWEVQLSEQVKASIGFNEDTTTVRQSLFLDINDDGSLGTGANQNIGLGRLREALGQNVDGQPWAPGMLQGSAAIVRVVQNADRNDPSIVYNNVVRVAKAA